MFKYAYERGVNYIDMYASDPVFQENIGYAIKKLGRSNIYIQGHLCSAWKNGQYYRTRNIDDTKKAFEDMLKQMNTSYIDVGMIHYCDEISDFDNIMNGLIIEYVKDLLDKGIIKMIGISTHNQRVAIKSIESGIINVIMLSVNPAYDMLPENEDVDILFEDKTFDRVYMGIDPLRDEMYKLSETNKVSITVMKPFSGGLLFDKKRSPFGKALTPVQCISYALDRLGVACVLVGVKNIHELEESLKYLVSKKEERDYSEIISKAPKKEFDGNCMYCGHCAPCTKGINIAKVNKFLDLAITEGKVLETVREHYDVLERHASECIACGKCLKNCPFGVDIIGKMKQARNVFGR